MLARYEYDVFGAIRSETGTSDNTRKFTGKEFDADSNLYYYAARYYDPYIGRFTQRDPIADGVNWYAYTYNNPLKFVDPDGLHALSPLETEALSLIFKGTINADDFEITMDPTLGEGKRATFGGLNEEGKFDVTIHPDFYAGLDGNSSFDNTDVLDPDVVNALGIFIHEATHAWQFTYKAFRGRSPLRPIPPGGGGFYGFNTFELTSLLLGWEQHASAVQPYFHIFWQLKRGATIIDLSMDFRYHDLPQQMHWDEAPTTIQSKSFRWELLKRESNRSYNNRKIINNELS